MSMLSGDPLEILSLCQMLACVVNLITYPGPHYHIVTAYVIMFMAVLKKIALSDVLGFENCMMKLLRHVSFVDCPV